MKKLILTIIFASVIGACTTTPPLPEHTYQLKENKEILSNDIVKKMLETALPAKTKLVMHAPTDMFGQALVQKLRKAGYAVTEIKPTDKADGVRFIYTIDNVDEFIRVTIKLSNENYSRAYLNDKPVNAWAKGVAQ